MSIRNAVGQVMLVLAFSLTGGGLLALLGSVCLPLAQLDVYAYVGAGILFVPIGVLLGMAGFFIMRKKRRDASTSERR